MEDQDLTYSHQTPYAVAADGVNLPTPQYMHRAWFAQVLKMATFNSAAQRAANFSHIDRWQTSSTDTDRALPYVLDTSFNTEQLCVYQPFFDIGHGDVAPDDNPVIFVFSGTHTAWDAMKTLVTTVTGEHYNLTFAPFATSISAYIAANPLLFTTNREIVLIGFSAGGTAALTCHTLLSEALPNLTFRTFVWNPWIGHWGTAPLVTNEERLNPWHAAQLATLRSSSITEAHWCRRVYSMCIGSEIASSQYWANLNNANEPLWWGECRMFEPLFDNGVQDLVNFPLGQTHSILQFCGTTADPYQTFPAGPPVSLKTASNDLLYGDYTIATKSHFGVTWPGQSATAASQFVLWNTAEDPNVLSTRFIPTSTTTTTVALASAGIAFRITVENAATGKHRITMSDGSSDLMIMTPHPVDVESYTIQRISDGAYMRNNIIGNGGAYTMPDAATIHAVDWMPQANWNSQDIASMEAQGVYWRLHATHHPDSHPRSMRRSISHQFYDILPSDGTVQKYIIYFTDYSHSSGSPQNFYMSIMQHGSVYGIEPHSLKPNTWWQTPAPIIDKSIEITGDESLFTMKSRYDANTTDYIVEIHSTVSTQYGRDMNPIITSAQLTNVASPFDAPAADATIHQLTNFVRLSASHFTAKLRVANLPVASSYLRFTEAAQSNTANGYYGAVDYTTEANATTWTFVKTTASLIIT